MVVSCCVRSAVEVSGSGGGFKFGRGRGHGFDDLADAVSKLSASLIMSALRRWACCCSFFACSPRSRSVSIMVSLKTCNASAMSAIFIGTACCDLYIQITSSNGFHAVLQPHKAAYGPTADVEPADEKRWPRLPSARSNQDNPALPGFRLGFTDRGDRRRLAGILKLATPFLLRERAISVTTVAPVFAATNSFCLRSKILPPSLLF